MTRRLLILSATVGVPVFATTTATSAPAIDPAQPGAPAATTDSEGRYRMLAVNFSPPPSPALVRVGAVRQPADTVRVETTGASLRPAGQAMDSLRVDVSFP